jgi:hypothetical protein
MPLNEIRFNLNIFNKKPTHKKPPAQNRSRNYTNQNPSKKKDPEKLPSNSQSSGRQFAIITGTLAVLFFILFGVNTLTRASWERGLREETQLVLDRTFPGQYLVKDRVTVTPAIDATGAAFELSPQEGNPFEQQRLGLIINVPTIFGPQPGVFLCEGENEGNTVRFAGFGFYSPTFDAESTVIINSQIPYLTRLLASSLVGQGGQR